VPASVPPPPTKDERLARHESLMRQVMRWSMATALEGKRTPQTEAEVERVQRVLQNTLERALILNLTPYPKQQRFLELRSKLQLFCGGNRVGKTTINLAKMSAGALGYCPWDLELAPPINFAPPVEIICAGPKLSTWVPLVVTPKLRQLLPYAAVVRKEGKMQAGVIDRLDLWNGSMIKFLSYDQDTEAWESWAAHLISFDEPMPKDKYLAARRGAMDFSAPILMSWTPKSEAWTFDDIYDQAVHVDETTDLTSIDTERICAITASTYDNPYLPVKEIEAMEKDCPEEEREPRLFGRYKHLIGRVYKNFDTSKHVRELEALV
jgi:hypothetical protein